MPSLPSTGYLLMRSRSTTCSARRSRHGSWREICIDRNLGSRRSCSCWWNEPRCRESLTDARLCSSRELRNWGLRSGFGAKLLHRLLIDGRELPEHKLSHQVSDLRVLLQLIQEPRPFDLNRIPATQPDVAVLDVRLGGDTESGVEMCRDVRSRHPEVRCIMLTSFADDNIVVEAISAGADGYLLKEVNRDGLVNAILDASK